MFHGELTLIRLPKPDMWALAQPLVWVGSACTIEVPAGFETDLASIPHFIDWIPILDRDGASRRPAALHDALYAIGRERGKDFADATLREALLSEGMSRAGAACYWWAVHRFGASSWKSDGEMHPFDTVGRADFMTKDDYADWLKRGGTIFRSQAHTGVVESAVIP